MKTSLSIASDAASTLGTDVRDVEAFEHALDRAVLAERAVKDRKGDLRVEQAARGSKLDLAAARQPASVALDHDLDHLVTGRAQAVGHRGAGRSARPRARSSGRR